MIVWFLFIRLMISGFVGRCFVIEGKFVLSFGVFFSFKVLVGLVSINVVVFNLVVKV